MSKTLTIAILCSVLFVAYFMVPMVIEDGKEMHKYCEERNITGQCNYGVARCYNDCESLGKDYFKRDDGGFGSAECWCKVNNETMQIW